jgi:hypothetical protein
MRGRSLRWWLLEGLDRFLWRVWPFRAIRGALLRHKLDRFAPAVARMNAWIDVNVAARKGRDQ